MKITKFKVNGKDAVVANSALEGQVLPVPGEGDAGKVPTVQEDGSYALSNAGGSNAPIICTDTEGTLDKTMGEILEAMDSGKNIYVDDTELRYLVVLYSPIAYNSRSQTYEGAISVITPLDSGTLLHYAVSEATEEAALAAYPTVQA